MKKLTNLQQKRQEKALSNFFTEERERHIKLADKEQQDVIFVNINKTLATFSNEIIDAYVSGVKYVKVRFKIPFCPNIYSLDYIGHLCLDKICFPIRASFQDLNEKPRWYEIDKDDYLKRREKDNNERYERLIFDNILLKSQEFLNKFYDVPTNVYKSLRYDVTKEDWWTNQNMDTFDLRIDFDDIDLSGATTRSCENIKNMDRDDKYNILEEYIGGTLDLTLSKKPIISDKEFLEFLNPIKKKNDNVDTSSFFVICFILTMFMIACAL